MYDFSDKLPPEVLGRFSFSMSSYWAIKEIMYYFLWDLTESPLWQRNLDTLLYSSGITLNSCSTCQRKQALYFIIICFVRISSRLICDMVI